MTDIGMKHLAGLATLRDLGLAKTHSTDTGLKEFAELKALQTLSHKSDESRNS